MLIWLLSRAAAHQDQIHPPGWGDYSQKVYSGYLSTASPDRQLHYFFVQSQTDTTQPVLLWLNGGPGCSSLLAAFTEHGPFKAPNYYRKGDLLKANPYSWNFKANVIYLQSPAAVGWSIDKNETYTDALVVEDNLRALSSFFSKFPWLSKNKLFISGESYGGKYIPHLARRILETGLFNLSGALVGNGIFNYLNHQKEKSSIEYLAQHNFVELQYKQMFRESCAIDYDSPRCGLLRNWFVYGLRTYFDIFNFYDVCYNKTTAGQSTMQECDLEQGLEDYLNNNSAAFNVRGDRVWHVCNDNMRYEIGQAGSIEDYRHILGKVPIIYYSGDLDSQAALTDANKNIGLLGLTPSGDYTPWFTDRQHSGFYQRYEEKFQLVTVKGAGHMAPRDKPAPCFRILSAFIQGLWLE